jgi:D-sedoheptulose 7-phosphate isomerase
MIKKEISDLKQTLDYLSEEENKVSNIITSLLLCLKNNNKILICGNGGSAAEAEHLSAEFLVRLKPTNNRRALPIVSLTQNSSVITACGNDLGFENIFSRTLEGVGNEGDVLFCLSTSGNSKNILNVLMSAKNKGIKSISLLGANGGKAKSLSDIDLTINSDDVARIQECHLFLGHYILSQVELKLINKE